MAFTIASFVIFMELQFISFNNCSPIQDFNVHMPLICFNFLASNNSFLKLFCTFGCANTNIFLFIPNCLKFTRHSSIIPTAAQVFPEPKPWYNNKLLYGVLKDKKFLTKI